MDRGLIDKHVEYWLDHMPDMSDLPVVRHGDLQFWTKQKRKDNTKAHRFLKGLKASWTNASVDFVISQNKWPVIFTNTDGKVVDLVDEVVLIFWVSYVRHMVRSLYIYYLSYTSDACYTGVCKHHPGKKVICYFMAYKRHLSPYKTHGI